jgi:hypothetical protein
MHKVPYERYALGTLCVRCLVYPMRKVPYETYVLGTLCVRCLMNVML